MPGEPDRSTSTPDERSSTRAKHSTRTTTPSCSWCAAVYVYAGDADLAWPSTRPMPTSPVPGDLADTPLLADCSSSHGSHHVDTPEAG